MSFELHQTFRVFSLSIKVLITLVQLPSYMILITPEKHTENILCAIGHRKKYRYTYQPFSSS